MLRTRPPEPDPPHARAGDTLPLPAPVPRPMSGSAAGSSLASTWLDRLRAAAVHVTLSAIVAGIVVAIVLLAWYPQPMPRLLGVDAILLIMLGVDVVLGPLFTFIVFDRRKPRLAWDLMVIAALQLGALGYGLYTVYQGRPAFVVLVKDRFEVISPAELRAVDRIAARGNPAAVADPLRPRWVAARLPDSPKERSDILFEALSQGRDVQHHPRLYSNYEAESRTALERVLPIERLRALNPTRGAEVDAAVAAAGRAEAALGYLPIRGPARDGAVLIDRADGRVLTVTRLTPW